MNERNSKDNYHAAQMMTNEILISKSLPQVRFWLIEYPNSNLDDITWESLRWKKQTDEKNKSKDKLLPWVLSAVHVWSIFHSVIITFIKC